MRKKRIIEAALLDSIRKDQKRLKILKTGFEIKRTEELIKEKTKILKEI
jgi:hypothetical protein